MHVQYIKQLTSFRNENADFNFLSEKQQCLDIFLYFEWNDTLNISTKYILNETKTKINNSIQYICG